MMASFLVACTTYYASFQGHTCFKKLIGPQSPFQLTTILGVVKQSATSTVAKDLKPGTSPWEAVGDAISRLIEEGGKLIPSILEHESVLKSKLTHFLAI